MMLQKIFNKRIFRSVVHVLAGVGGGDLVHHPGHPAAPGPAVAVARHVHAAPRHALTEIFSLLEIFSHDTLHSLSSAMIRFLICMYIKSRSKHYSLCN